MSDFSLLWLLCCGSMVKRMQLIFLNHLEVRPLVSYHNNFIGHAKLKLVGRNEVYQQASLNQHGVCRHRDAMQLFTCGMDQKPCLPMEEPPLVWLLEQHEAHEHIWVENTLRRLNRLRWKKAKTIKWLNKYDWIKMITNFCLYTVHMHMLVMFDCMIYDS